MRRRIYVLYRFKMDGFAILQDRYTPLYKLTTLDHCYGVYESYKGAYLRAKEVLENEINNLKDQIQRLKKGL